jgi:hypothetical protein
MRTMYLGYMNNVDHVDPVFVFVFSSCKSRSEGSVLVVKRLKVLSSLLGL